MPQTAYAQTAYAETAYAKTGPIGTAYITGLPGDLPPGEHILWQGAPAWRPLARRLCHVRTVALYFAVVAAGTTALLLVNGARPLTILLAVLPLVLAGLLVTGFLAVLAFWIARSTEYTLTTHRLVMRFGLALNATLAIPHCLIAHAGIRLHADGTGNLPIETKPGFKIALHRVWPHARPWRLLRAQPMLLCVPNAGPVATLLARTLAAAEASRLRQAVPAETPAEASAEPYVPQMIAAE